MNYQMIRHRLSWVLVVGFGVTLCMVLIIQPGYPTEKSFAPIQNHLERLTQALNKQFRQSEIRVDDARPHQSRNILDGCRYVYLDVGSNVGIQVRKLFEPDLYPDALVHKVFNEAFGNPRDLSVICSVGFEPNPNHSKKLSQIEKHYAKCGWNARFFKESAVSNREGFTSFFTDDDQYNLEWGAGLVGGKNKRLVSNVTLIRLAAFIVDVVGTREIPDAVNLKDPPPAVVMKVDIEGSEVEVIPDLVLTGALNFVDYMTVEWHEHLSSAERKEVMGLGRSIVTNLDPLTKKLKMKHKLRVVDQDDETYYLSDEPFSNCPSHD
ncbi:uncharacterized protein LOC131882819 [Tigriopus californicus]|uniref:uncharacterized protein LOC131882819 n=1 Tax=Tigriopus californicus TaxID=6832 RepID=UPI0027DA1CFB|nr:uncharacterized protein LOC131882819 [Tigriopus californicus]